jgi:formylglycine-generating enzyme required for sulfatase activity
MAPENAGFSRGDLFIMIHLVRIHAAGLSHRVVLLFIVMAIGVFLLSGGPCVFAQGAGARVENLKVRQEGRDVLLTYDLAGKGAKDEVIVEISLDRGRIWKKPKGLWGDVGKGIAPGKGKRVQWATLEEFPQGLDAEVRFRVITLSEREGPAAGGEARAFTVKGVSFKMVRIPAGEFMMGSPPNEPGRDNGETHHRVRISRDFWLGQTEVTQGLWKAVMGSNPSYFSNCGDDCPVEKVSWNDCQEFIRKLNGMVSGGNFRLPTEAEWEYACRGGTTTPFHTGRCLNTDQANYNGNYPLSGCSKGEKRERTVKVGSFAPNAWGLYNMHGNVWEWCQDRHGDYPSGAVTEPAGPLGGSSRVYRGGSWSGHAAYCRSAMRSGSEPDYRGGVGLRLARTESERTTGGEQGAAGAKGGLTASQDQPSVVPSKPDEKSYLALSKTLEKEKPSEAGVRLLQVYSIAGSFVDTAKSGQLFVIRGMVKSQYPQPRSNILVKGSILDNKGKAVDSRVSYAGITFTEGELKTLPIEEVLKALQNRDGNARQNFNVPSGASIPFMVVFQNLPDNMSDEFAVEMVSSSPGD